MLPFSKKRLWTTSETTALLFLFRYIVQCSYQCIYLQQHQQRWMKIDKDWLVISWKSQYYISWKVNDRDRKRESKSGRQREWVRITNKQLINMQSTINNFSLNTSLFFSIFRMHSFLCYCVLTVEFVIQFQWNFCVFFLVRSLFQKHQYWIVCYFTCIQHLLQSSSSHWFQSISMEMGDR